jgi:peroxiredoxin
MNRGRWRNTGLIVLSFTMLCGMVLGTLFFFVLSHWISGTYVSPEGSATSNSGEISGTPDASATSDAWSSLPEEPSASRGSTAPDFQVLDLEGALISLSDYQDQVVLINFWATWCGPCRDEMPIFQDYYEQFADQGFVVIALSCSSLSQDVLAFQQELGLSFPIAIDLRDDVQDLYRIWTYPTTFVVDREGIIRYIHYGSMTDSVLDRYLAGVGIGS